jgi:hypothetical protein
VGVFLSSIFFEKKTSFNIRITDYKRITRIVRKDYEKYQGLESNFIRCAILKLLREEEYKKTE